MSEGEAVEAELPLESVGAQLLRAREAAGMSRTQLAAITRIPERHLAAIEAGNFAALPASTYAVGFSRSYAKALGLDEAGVAAEVRAELAANSPDLHRRPAPTFEPGDPARVHSSRLTWLAALGVVAAIVAGMLLWRSLYAPSGSLGSILPMETPKPAVPTPAAPAVPAPGGPVVFTALAPDVWVKFYDGAGNQFLQKQLAQGESWTVPADQPQVLIRTGRPEALAITIGGQPVPRLSETQRTIKDVPVTAAALLARGNEAAVSGPPVTTSPATSPARQQVPGRVAQSGPGGNLPAAPAEARPSPASAIPPAAPATAPAPSAT